jgi:hypothetical protein
MLTPCSHMRSPLQARYLRHLGATAVAAFCGLHLGWAQAQTPTLERLKEALALERKTDLVGAQSIYQSLLTDADWAAAAQLSLARVQRWQSLHAQAITNYAAVLASPQATAGMRDEASLGLAHIDALEYRLPQAAKRLDSIPLQSAIANQVQDLRERLAATHPTRIGANYGQVHNKGGSTDNSWQLKLTHQIDMKNAMALSYSRNSLQQRTTQPDAALDFVKGQWQAAWRYQVPLGVAYSVEATHRQLSLGSSESNLRFQGSWPIAKDWRASASISQLSAAGTDNTSASAGLSTKISKDWQLGANIYAAEATTGPLYSWMVNTTWEQGPWLAQWFVSRTLDDSPVTNVLVLRQRLSSGPTWRAEIKHDRNGNTAILGLDIPWGRHVTSASIQTSPFATQWSAGFDYAWPNGLEKTSRRAP